jgi:hypothetical protein
MIGGMGRFAQRVTDARRIPTRGGSEFPSYAHPRSPPSRCDAESGSVACRTALKNDGRRLSAKPARAAAPIAASFSPAPLGQRKAGARL